MQTFAAVLAAVVTATAIAAGLLLLVVGVRLGDGDTVSERRVAGAPFTRVDARGSSDVEVEVRAGARPTVTVQAGEEAIDDVETRVENGALVVDGRDDDAPLIDFGTSTPRILVVVPMLREAALHGSGDLTIDGLDAGAFTVALDGSGDVEARGQVALLTAELDGSGDLDLQGLRAERGTVLLDGSGDVDVLASEALDLTLDGSGDISYGGTAQVTEHLDGSGDISRDG